VGQGDQVRRHQAAVKLPEARYSITFRSAKMTAGQQAIDTTTPMGKLVFQLPAPLPSLGGR
jgi:hypothetical protein